jgi:hypothetical protein
VERGNWDRAKTQTRFAHPAVLASTLIGHDERNDDTRRNGTNFRTARAIYLCHRRKSRVSLVGSCCTSLSWAPGSVVAWIGFVAGRGKSCTPAESVLVIVRRSAHELRLRVVFQGRRTAGTSRLARHSYHDSDSHFIERRCIL